MSECQREPQDWPHEESGEIIRRYPMVGWVHIRRITVSDTQAIEQYKIQVCGNAWKNWVFLGLTTKDGLGGVGECSLNGFAKTTVACIEELSPYFLGKRPEEYATTTQRMLTNLYSDAGQLHRGVIAAVEMACLDILGKRAGLPVYALLGGKVRDEIPAYANGWYRVERTPEGFERAARRAMNLRYEMLKYDPFGSAISPFDVHAHASSAEIMQALERTGPIKGLGWGGKFAVECHQRLDCPDARWLVEEISRLGRYRFSWIEEPFPWWDQSGLAALAATSVVPIATGENLTSVRQFEDLASHSSNLILQPDVMNLGGITKALEVCRLAERYGLRVCPHDAQGPVSRACCVQLAALSPAVWMLEDFDPWNAPWTREIATTFRTEEGMIGFQDMPPGLGVTLHWDKVREHPYDPNGWVPLFETGWEKRREG